MVPLRLQRMGLRDLDGQLKIGEGFDEQHNRLPTSRFSQNSTLGLFINVVDELVAAGLCI